MSINKWGIISENDKLERVNANKSCFRWKLGKFSSIERTPQRRLIAGAFTATGSYVDWRMQFFPNGRSEKDKNDLIIVGVEYMTRAAGITVSFEVSVVNNDGEVMEEYKLKRENLNLVTDKSECYQRYVDAGFFKLKLRRSDVENPENRILKDDCLTIALDITYHDPMFVPAVPNTKRIESLKEKILESEKLLENDEFSDVTFVVGDKEIRVHKAILAMRSPVFKAIFQHNMQEEGKNVVKIVDIEYAVLMELFRFMYTGAVGNIENIACGLLLAAEKYCVERLKSLCETTLLDNLKIDNAVDCFAAADACNMPGLKKQAFDFILNHADEIVDRDQFISLSPNLMLELFRSLVKIIPKKSE